MWSSSANSVTLSARTMRVLRSDGYFLMTCSSSFTMIFRIFVLDFTISSSFLISFSSASVSCVRFRIYSLLMLRRRMSAMNSAWIWSMSKPSIRFGMTFASSSVPRMMAIALSMSSRILRRPSSRCSLSFFLPSSKNTRRRTHSVRHDVHSSKICCTPRTRGMPPMRTLKLHEKLSWSVVSFIRRAISFSGSVPRLRSMAILRPERSVSSRTSAISRTLPVLTSSAILSMMASIVVVYGISVTSMRFSFLSYCHFARTLNEPRPLS